MTDTLLEPKALPHSEELKHASPALSDSSEPRDLHFTREDFHEFINVLHDEIHNRLLFHHLAVCK